MTLDEFLGRLKGAKRNGDGWTALCPAHEDRNPSLSVHEHGGKVLVHCHAGCRTEDILSVLGLTMADLFRGAAQPKQQTTYPYLDENGTLLFEVVRYEPKAFKQRRPDGGGCWIWNLDSVRRVPYNLPEVIKAKTVLVCEGEKDCETARALGLWRRAIPAAPASGDLSTRSSCAESVLSSSPTKTSRAESTPARSPAHCSAWLRPSGSSSYPRAKT